MGTFSADASPRLKRPRFLGNQRLAAVPLWVGRDALLEELRQQLWELPLGDESPASPLPTQPMPKPKILVLVGQGGIGKTSLAVKLLEGVGANCEAGTLRSDCPYDGILVLSARQGIGFDEVVRELTQALELPENEGVAARETIDTILRGLQRQRWLLVFDNWEDALYPATHQLARRSISPELGQLLNALAYRPHSSQVILTSREMPKDLADERDELGGPDPMLVAVRPVDGISQEASVELLRQRGLRDSEADLRWVARRVGGQVLVLVLLANLARGKRGMLRQKPELVTRKAEPVVRAQLARHPEAARELLRRMCVLRAGVDLRGLTFLRCYSQSDDPPKSPLRRGTSTHIPTLESGTSESSALQMTEVEIARTETLVEQLVGTSLVQKRFDESKVEDYYDLHRVIAEVVRDTCRGALPGLMQAAYAFYRTENAVEKPETLEDLQPMLEAQYFAFELGNYTEAENLIYRLEKYLEPWGYWTLHKQLCEQILPHLDEASQPYILQRLGLRYRDWGDWQQAEDYYREALHLAQRYQNNSAMATSWGLLGDIERNRGNWEAAESLYRQSLQLREELGDRARMATSWGLLGDIERNRGNWEAAESLYRQSLQLCEELGDRPGVASNIGSLGENERGRGNLDSAEALLKDALEKMETLGMTWHIAEANGDLAQLYRDRGNSDLAQQHYTTARTLFEKLGAVKDLEKIDREWNGALEAGGEDYP